MSFSVVTVTFRPSVRQVVSEMSELAGDNSKPRVLVLGGCGFIGRNLVEYLVANDLVSAVRAVDKTPPQLAFLNPAHTKIFEDPRVEYKSANLINPTSCSAAMAPGELGWALAFNCAGETRPGQAEAVYAEGICALSRNVAQQCDQQRIRLVEISSGQMYSSDKPHKEDGPVDPWTVEARMKSRVEQELAAMPTLRYTVVRPAIVYGVGDRRSLTPRLLLGAIYKHLNETMKLLWTADLRMNTVHVSDVCRAMWALARAPAAERQVYNLVDEADSTQGSLARLVCDIFKIRHDYYGTAISTLAKSDIASVADEANDKHLDAWADICRRYGLTHSPLEPGAAAELLLHRHLCLDGAKLRAAAPAPAVPAPTRDNLLQPVSRPGHLCVGAARCAGAAVRVRRPSPRRLLQVLEDYASMNLFPKELLL